MTNTAMGSDLVRQEEKGIVIAAGGGWLKLQGCGDDIFHVQYSTTPTFSTHTSLVVQPQTFSQLNWSQSAPDQITVAMAKLKARVDLKSGAITFLDLNDRVLLAEQDRNIEPADVQGHQTFHIQQRWQGLADESLYGLGEQQLGVINIKGLDLDLWQHNGTIVVPFLTSSKGYGILWDNASLSRFGDLRPWQPITEQQLLDATGNAGGFTARYFSDDHFSHPILNRVDKDIDIEERPEINGVPTSRPSTPLSSLHRGTGSVRWEGSVVPDKTGDYQFQAFSSGDIKVWIDGKLVMNHWRQVWLPWIDIVRVHLEANHKYPLKVEWSVQQGTTIKLTWKPPAQSNDPANTPTSLWSEVADGIDYYFVHGANLDDVVSGYRKLTGTAPMMPAWAFGLWQSRQRYETAQQSLDVIDGFRSRKIPFDNIVQDWFYWPKDAWGSHQFDPERFPDPKAWVDAIHNAHAHVMISVWGKFYKGTKNFDEMNSRGFLYQPNLKEGLKDWVGYAYTFFDAFDSAAQKLFWAQVKPALFDKGVDAWWLDATEPDVLGVPTLEQQKSHVVSDQGPGVLNAYSIMMGQTFYNGQRSVSPDQRVFILTRSGFASQQRYAEASWSGDTTSTWTAMHKQISAGIGFCMSGIPYWTMDIGGFAVPPRFSSKNPSAADIEEWRELNTRWFEFGAFCPIFRVHGEFPFREMWEFGGESSPAYQAQLKFDRLRYRLLPYVYSLAGEVTHDGGTIMRGLAMDFPDDASARDIPDEYMFGPAFLVCPVTTYQARTRSVYLPLAKGWYDFWTGVYSDGGQKVEAPAPYDAMPVYVRAGSIIPMGPEIQYTAEKPADPITLFVYSGADAKFNLYEDDGLTYGYERGESTVIPIHWDDAAKKLTIGPRVGKFPGMLQSRTFNVVFVSPAKPIKFSFSPPDGKSVKYDGQTVQVDQ